MHYRPQKIRPPDRAAAASRSTTGQRTKARISLAAWPIGYHAAFLGCVVLARIGLTLAFLLARRTAVASAGAARAGPGGSRNLAVNQQSRPKHRPPAAQELSCTRRSWSN
ncbi:MAG TPA: hypothetical protein VF506_13385 [Streptosporangiaceae bacterium]